mmetsp:Transcript_9073/g.13405  ORF Transcript_9073/g.13405 Transcript_9073/m.13405 type:complete len:522 (+) Transcript_9073:2-1567(+)
MDEELVDQIRDKFGANIAHVFDDSSNVSKFQREAEANFDDAEFQEAFHRYMYNCLGSRDVYCCPICYVQAVKKGYFVQHDDNHSSESSQSSSSQEDENGEEEQEEASPGWLDHVVSEIDRSDPMETLNCLDRGALQIASTICFRKLVDVKNHLKTVHMVDLSNLDGNHLFDRFRIRGTDGLLQRFIFKDGHRNPGVLQHYWFYGNSGLLLHIFYLVDYSECIEPEAHMFCAAIGRERGDAIWRVISAPYEKLNEDDCDFIAGNDEASISASSSSGSDIDNDGDGNSADKEEEEILDPEEQIVRELRRRRGVPSDSSSSNNGTDESQSDDNEDDQKSDESVLSVNDDDDANDPEGDFSESEEEEDDWIKQKRSRPKKSTSLLTPPKTGRRLKNSAGRLINLTDTSIPLKSFQIHSQSKRKSLSDSSSDDGSLSSSDFVKKRGGTPMKSPPELNSKKATMTTPLMNDLSIKDNDGNNLQSLRRIRSPDGKNISVHCSTALGEVKTPSSKTKRIVMFEDSDEEE